MLFRSLVDVRTAEELAFVGRLPGSLHIPWATGLNMAPNPDFLEQLATLVPRQAEVLFLCRSGKRSLAAARLAAANGWHRAYNIAEGFEGELDPGRQRGKLNGWRRRGLPWVQD